MNMWSRIGVIAAFFLLSSCSDGLDDPSGFYIYKYTADFSQSSDNWWGDFTDYPVGENDSLNYELKISYTDLPSNVADGKKAIMISGNNHSDDLFMFIKKKISGLPPSTDYTVVFDIELASNAPTGAIGAGGAPGESVFLKVGAVSMEPKKVIEGNYYRINIDKGEQSQSGENMIAIGNVGVSPTTSDYTTIGRSNLYDNIPFVARSNSRGELWLIIGTDSGFEGVTTLYYTQVNVVLSRSN